MIDRRTGSLRHPGQIQEDSGEFTDGTDSHGQPRERWRKVFDAFAAVTPLRGREFWNARQVQADTTHLLTFRYRPEWREVTAKHRFLDQTGRVYHFTEPPRVFEERGEWVEVMVKEADNA